MWTFFFSLILVLFKFASTQFCADLNESKTMVKRMPTKFIILQLFTSIRLEHYSRIIISHFHLVNSKHLKCAEKSFSLIFVALVLIKYLQNAAKVDKHTTTHKKKLNSTVGDSFFYDCRSVFASIRYSVFVKPLDTLWNRCVYIKHIQ